MPPLPPFGVPAEPARAPPPLLPPMLRPPFALPLPPPPVAPAPAAVPPEPPPTPRSSGAEVSSLHASTRSDVTKATAERFESPRMPPQRVHWTRILLAGPREKHWTRGRGRMHPDHAAVTNNKRNRTSTGTTRFP